MANSYVTKEKLIQLYDSYIKEKEKTFWEDLEDNADFFEEFIDKDNLFKVNPRYDYNEENKNYNNMDEMKNDDFVQNIRCSECGGTKFNVGKCSKHYATYIRCIKCKWEQLIHEG